MEKRLRPMDKQLDGINGVTVLDELIRQLKTRESIGRMLGDLGARDPDALVAKLVDELERIVKWQHLQYELLAGSSPVAPRSEPGPKPKSEPGPGPGRSTELEPKTEPEPAPVAPADVALAQTTPPLPGPPEKVTLSESATRTSEQDQLNVDESEDPIRRQLPRVPSELETDDYLYLHGVSRIESDETPATVPFLLEEKGIDNRRFAFAIDYQGLRFYGSKLSHESTNVTKNGVLLLSKQENIRLRGAHEGILNDLRLHGILLPFEFGTVFHGPAELDGKIRSRFNEIKDALDELLKTRWWNLVVYALDSRTADLVGQSTPDARRENDRGRVPYSSPAQTKRIDVKTLERILNKQKRAAESIHEVLQPYAERFDIDMMVSLQSGASDDWKIILRASYELGPSMLSQFVRTVTDLQYQHFLMELMFSLTGNVEKFSFAKQ